MTFQSDKMQLNCIQTLLVSECNDIYVCVDKASSSLDKYLVVLLKNHETIKKFIEICASDNIVKENFLIDQFSEQGKYVLVFAYNRRRPLSDFYVGDAMNLLEVEEVCSNLVLSCIQSGLPYPLLYLVIRQGQLNLNRDRGVYISYEIDMTDLDIEKGEKDCVVECARILVSLYESKQKQKAVSYTLLQKKIRSYGYSKFTELYRDITIASSPKNRINIVGKIIALWHRSKDQLFKALLVLCVILIVMAVVSFISQLIFGDVPWLSVLFNNFKQIGTESLVQ